MNGIKTRQLLRGIHLHCDPVITVLILFETQYAQYAQFIYIWHGEQNLAIGSSSSGRGTRIWSTAFPRLFTL